MTTAGDLINGSLRLLGVLAEGETPSAETSQDALVAMNQMVQSWNTERLRNRPRYKLVGCGDDDANIPSRLVLS